MTFKGVTIANGKAVMVHYNPGWGDPGEWYLNFSDKTLRVIDDPAGMGKDQLDYLNRLNGDKYRQRLFDCDWNTLGNSDDVVRIVLEYLGYNDDNLKEDEQRLAFEAEKIRGIAQEITATLSGNDFSLEALNGNVNDLNRQVNDSKEYIEAIHYRIRVYRLLKEGNPVGVGWNNASFLRDFGNSEYAKFLPSETNPETKEDQ
jgi:hypothetical protein